VQHLRFRRQLLLDDGHGGIAHAQLCLADGSGMLMLARRWTAHTAG
jgi:UDP-N-acetyl-D-mannosaminuronic acid transferase (WecB/TagA/CpsF family)